MMECVVFCNAYSRTVIGVGVEEEDRLDQWIEDAESVSLLIKSYFIDYNAIMLSSHMHTCTLHV